MVLDGDALLGPSTLVDGYMTEDSFTICDCFCTLNCNSINRSCCIDENECGECLPGFAPNEFGECEKNCEFI